MSATGAAHASGAVSARPSAPAFTLPTLAGAITACDRCPRLRAHCREIGRVRKREFAGEEYWARPVPGLGDPRARLLIIGLAPAAHGANRTGQLFTGDSSGSWLYEAAASVRVVQPAQRAPSRRRLGAHRLLDHRRGALRAAP